MRKPVRICLAASAGGHLTQLLKVSEGWTGRDVFFVTTSEAVRGQIEKEGEVFVVGECNRNMPIRTLKVFWRCARIIIKNKPGIIISTGAAHGCILCFLGKAWGAKVMWIDSITNVERISLSGRMVRYIADKFLVQWPELARKYRNVEYGGTII